MCNFFLSDFKKLLTFISLYVIIITEKVKENPNKKREVIKMTNAKITIEKVKNDIITLLNNSADYYDFIDKVGSYESDLIDNTDTSIGMYFGTVDYVLCIYDVLSGEEIKVDLGVKVWALPFVDRD